MAAILISIVLNSDYGMPRGQIHINLPPEHPIMSFETIEIKMAAISAKRSMTMQLRHESWVPVPFKPQFYQASFTTAQVAA